MRGGRGRRAVRCPRSFMPVVARGRDFEIEEVAPGRFRWTGQAGLCYPDEVGVWHRTNCAITQVSQTPQAQTQAALIASLQKPTAPAEFDLACDAIEFPARFSSLATGGQKIQTWDGSKFVIFRAQGVNAVPGSIAGNKVTYQGAFDDAALAFYATPEGIVKEIVLNSRPQGNAWFFAVEFGGLTPLFIDNEVIWQDGAGNEVWRTRRPFAIDAEGNTVQGMLTVRQVGADIFFDVSIDPAWLDRAVYPVVVDPTTTIQPGGKDSYIDTITTVPQGSSPQLRVESRYDSVKGDVIRRSLVSFSPLPSGYISSATLTLVSTASYSGGGLLRVYKLTRDDWSEANATWSEYDSGKSWTSPGGDYVTTSPSGASLSCPSLSAGTAVDFPVTSIVADAVALGINANFIVLFSSSYVTFASKENTTDLAWRPKLTIDYTTASAPTVITNAASSITTSDATLNGTLSSDGGEACSCSFEWGTTTSYGNTTAAQSKTSGQPFSQAISGLSPGTTYHYRAKATNSAGTSYGTDSTFRTPSVHQAGAGVAVQATATGGGQKRARASVSVCAGAAGTSGGQTRAQGTGSTTAGATVTATSTRKATASPALSAGATAAVTARDKVTGSGTVSAGATATAAGGRRHKATSTVMGDATAAAQGTSRHRGAGAGVSRASVTGTGRMRAIGGAVATAGGLSSSTEQVRVRTAGNATATATGQAPGSVKRTTGGSPVSAASAATAAGGRRFPASGAATGSGTATAGAHARYRGDAQVSAAATVAGVVRVVLAVSGTVAAGAEAESDLARTRPAAAAIAAQAAVEAGARAKARAAGAVEGTCAAQGASRVNVTGWAAGEQGSVANASAHAGGGKMFSGTAEVTAGALAVATPAYRTRGSGGAVAAAAGAATAINRARAGGQVTGEGDATGVANVRRRTGAAAVADSTCSAISARRHRGQTATIGTATGSGTVSIRARVAAALQGLAVAASVGVILLRGGASVTSTAEASAVGAYRWQIPAAVTASVNTAAQASVRKTSPEVQVHGGATVASGEQVKTLTFGGASGGSVSAAKGITRRETSGACSALSTSTSTISVRTTAQADVTGASQGISPVVLLRCTGVASCAAGAVPKATSQVRVAGHAVSTGIAFTSAGGIVQGFERAIVAPLPESYRASLLEERCAAAPMLETFMVNLLRERYATVPTPEPWMVVDLCR